MWSVGWNFAAASSHDPYLSVKDRWQNPLPTHYPPSPFPSLPPCPDPPRHWACRRRRQRHARAVLARGTADACRRLQRRRVRHRRCVPPPAAAPRAAPPMRAAACSGAAVRTMPLAPPPVPTYGAQRAAGHLDARSCTAPPSRHTRLAHRASSSSAQRSTCALLMCRGALLARRRGLARRRSAITRAPPRVSSPRAASAGARMRGRRNKARLDAFRRARESRHVRANLQ